MAFVSECVPARMTKHMGMRLQFEAKATAGRTLDHPGKPAVVKGEPPELIKTHGDGLLSR